MSNAQGTIKTRNKKSMQINNKHKPQFYFAIGLCVFAWIYTSVFVANCKIIQHDGAFNTQAAINLFQEGRFALDYRKTQTLQTLLPFQFVNGIFFNLFGTSFTVANFASVFFFALLTAVVIFLCVKTSSPILSFAFAALSISPSFTEFGFSGFGEAPALTLALMSACVTLWWGNITVGLVTGGLLLALAVSTKWVMWLSTIPFILLLILLKPKRSSLIVFGVSFLVTFLLVSIVQYSEYSRADFITLFGSLLEQNKPKYYVPEYQHHVVQNKIHTINDLWVRVGQVWGEYSLFSPIFFAPSKIILALTLFLVALRLLLHGEKPLDKPAKLFVFLSFFLTIYLLWGFFMNARWFSRRLMNTDILLFIALGMLPSMVSLKRMGQLSLFGFLFTTCCIFAYWNFTQINDCLECTVKKYEKELRSGLNSLPPSYRPYGYARLEGPRWSLLARRKFKDLFADNIFYDCINGTCENYIFFEPTTSSRPYETGLVEEVFNFKEVFDFKSFKIAKLLGFSNKDKQYVEAIEFEGENYRDSVTTLSNKNRHLMYGYPPIELNEFAVFLDNSKGFKFVDMEFLSNKCQEGKNLRIAVLNLGGQKSVSDYKIISGSNKIKLPLSPMFQHSNIDLYFLLERTQINLSTECSAWNANETGLEFKRVRVGKQ